MHRKKFFSLLVLSFGALFLSGCEESDGLQTITGTATFQGQPIPEGRIQFRFLDGDQKAYSSPIEEGEYLIRIPPGPASVEILASRPAPGKFDESNPGERVPIGEMYIPQKYNSRTELRVDVQPGAGKENFDLVP
jgi:hypothetical protein